MPFQPEPTQSGRHMDRLPPPKLGQPLSERELAIAHEIARGFMNQEIADHMGISEQTVKNHIWEMFRKLGAESRTEVLDKLGWIHDDDVYAQAAFVAAAIVHMRRDLSAIVEDAQRLMKELR